MIRHRPGMTEIRNRNRRGGFLCFGALREVLVLTSVVGIALTVLWQASGSFESHLASQWRDVKGNVKAVMALSIDEEQGTLFVHNWPSELKTISLETGISTPQPSGSNIVSAVMSAKNSTIVMMAQWAEDYQIRHRIDFVRHGNLLMSEELTFESPSFANIFVSDDGQVALLISEAGYVIGWDLSESDSKRWEYKLNRLTPRCRISPDGRLLAIAPEDGNVFLCETRTGVETHQLSEPGRTNRTLAWATDGKRVAIGDETGSLHVFDAERGTCVWNDRLHFEFARSIALSNDGNQLAAGGFDNVIRVWDLSQPGSPPLELIGQQGVTRCLKFTQAQTDERLVSGSLDGTIHLWSLATGKSIRQLQ